MNRYTLVLLKWPPTAGNFSEAELDVLQEQHISHLAAMKAAGHMLAGGPFRRQPDETLRGLCLYRTSLEETRALAESDPSVMAGRLAVDVFDWITPEGELPPNLNPGS